MPTSVPHAAPASRTPDAARASLPHLSLTVEADRAEHLQVLLGGAAQSLLSALGAPAPLARHFADAARIAGHYLAGHSEQPRCQLRITTDADGVTLAVTDYLVHDTVNPPAWLPVSRTGQLQPTTAPLVVHAPGDRADRGLALHRTPDGHLRLAYRGSWPTC